MEQIPEEKKTLAIAGDDLTIAFAGDCSQLRLWESKEQMERNEPPIAEIDFADAYRMEIFWVRYWLCFGKIFKKLTGRGINLHTPGKQGK